jgi:hypothetical protein
MNIVGVITMMAKETVRVRVMDVRSREPIKGIRRLKGKRQLGKHFLKGRIIIKLLAYVRVKLWVSTGTVPR